MYNNKENISYKIRNLQIFLFFQGSIQKYNQVYNILLDTRANTTFRKQLPCFSEGSFRNTIVVALFFCKRARFETYLNVYSNVYICTSLYEHHVVVLYSKYMCNFLNLFVLEV